MAIGFGAAKGISSAKHVTEVFGAHEALGNAMLGIPQLKSWIVIELAENADGVGQVWTSPYSQENQFSITAHVMDVRMNVSAAVDSNEARGSVAIDMHSKILVDRCTWGGLE